ncbi:MULTISPECIES: hypothetical protein [unclassified Sporosarcina]|nr:MULTISPECIES: hypothetical protein [unclassified Sporosarcina]
MAFEVEAWYAVMKDGSRNGSRFSFREGYGEATLIDVPGGRFPEGVA